MGMGIWLALGLGAALGDSGADVLTKRYFVQLSPYGMALVRLLGAVPFLALVALGLSLPELTPAFLAHRGGHAAPGGPGHAPLHAGPAPLPPLAVRPFPGLYPGFPDLHRLAGAGRTSEPLGGGRAP